MRAVQDVVDGGGLYFSRAATGGGFVFLASVAVNSAGELAAEATVEPPYHLAPAAHVRAQTAYILSRYAQLLPKLGSSIDQVIQVEQFIQYKSHADGYIETSRGPGFFERNRPASALVEVGDLLPPECVVNPTAIAIVPQGELVKEPISDASFTSSLTKQQFGETYVSEGPFNEIVLAGPYVMTVGDGALDLKEGRLPDSVRVPDWMWWGSEIRNEAQFVLNRLAARLDGVGSSLEHAVHCTVYLTDIEDLYELDLVWKTFFPTDPPARTVIPVRGLGVPRTEGARGHGENALKMEAIFQSIRPGFDVEKEVVAGDSAPPTAHESSAVKAGPLLWVSNQFAHSKGGVGAATEAQRILATIEEICVAGGSSLRDLLMLRIYVTNPMDAYVAFSALRVAVPRDPPCVAVTTVPGPLQVPHATMAMDAVAYAPE